MPTFPGKYNLLSSSTGKSGLQLGRGLPEPFARETRLAIELGPAGFAKQEILGVDSKKVSNCSLHCRRRFPHSQTIMFMVTINSGRTDSFWRLAAAPMTVSEESTVRYSGAIAKLDASLYGVLYDTVEEAFRVQRERYGE